MMLAHDLLGPADAPPLVLVHGITENRATWAPVAELLSADPRVLSVDLPLVSLEPLLRGTTEQFRTAIGMVFDGMRGPLSDDEVGRIESIRRPDQTVVLGTCKAVLETSAAELDATVAAMAAAVRVPYLSLHGIDPGPEYAVWLSGQIPQAIVEVWPDHGHSPHLVHTPRFLARFAAFERELAA